MDLVSITLDKYIKHRFNGAGMNQTGSNTKGLPVTNGDARNETSTSNGTDTNDNCRSAFEEEDDSELPSIIHHISLSNLRPCCVAISEDNKFLGLGFENSQIHLHRFSSICSQPNSTQQFSHIESGLLEEPSSSITNLNATSTSPSSLTVEETSRLLAHYGPVYSIRFVKNNDLMLSCSEDTTIRLWCLKTKCNIAIYRGHNYPVWSLSIGPRGEYFASTSMDATARLWRFDKITPLRIFCGHDGDVECVAFHPNSKYIATGSSDTTVRLWSISDAKMVRLMIGHAHSISSLSFIPNGKFLASADVSGFIKIWNLSTNDAITNISTTASQTISFSPGQSFVSTCGRDNILQICRIEKSQLIEKRRIDFSDQHITLISSIFLDDKLFVISYKSENDKFRNEPTMTDTNNMIS